MYLSVIDRRTKARFFFAGYDTSKRGLCRWSQSILDAVNISIENAEKLRRYLILNSIFDYRLHRFEAIDEQRQILHKSI